MYTMKDLAAIRAKDVEARQALAADVKRRVEISSNATKEKKKKTRKERAERKKEGRAQ